MAQTVNYLLSKHKFRVQTLVLQKKKKKHIKRALVGLKYNSSVPVLHKEWVELDAMMKRS
jgi:hypothetical protein